MHIAAVVIAASYVVLAQAADAPPTEKKEKQIEKKAELTPIVPSPHDVTKPAFQLYAELDVPVLATSVVLASVRSLRTQKAYCAPQCDPAELNSFDRKFAGRWDPNWARVSDYGLYSLGVGSVVLLVADEGVVPMLNDAVVIGEATLLANALVTSTTIAGARPRPFLYDDKAPLDARNSPNAALSLISGHTITSFALATSTFMAVRRLNPNSSLQWWTLGIGLAVAGTVATARVMSGNHFPTDVIAGATVGSSVGIVVPALHGSPVRVVPKVTETGRGLDVVGVF